MDAVCVGIGLAFFAMAWRLVRAFSHLQGERQS
jgi:hypothetical protein